ncbi:hypothetical protein HAX54_053036 [Datura stramonium]|uniref:Uncharacterized protein n=1 Tax=Datura stramonium TaxID=4076 RepID=A0ABS8WRT5_DATST|nr:hypothetical protein [Datura stramonium]
MTAGIYSVPVLTALIFVGFQTMPEFDFKVYFSTYFLTLRSRLFRSIVQYKVKSFSRHVSQLLVIIGFTDLYTLPNYSSTAPTKCICI